MSVIDWLLRRRPSGRRMGGGFRGSQSDLIRDTKAAIEAVAVGDGPAGGRFPKLADAAPTLLTQTPTSAVVTKDGLAPTVNIWDLDRPGNRLDRVGDRVGDHESLVIDHVLSELGTAAPDSNAGPVTLESTPAADTPTADTQANADPKLREPSPREDEQRRSSRIKTRALGFEQPTAVVPLFGEGRMEVGKPQADAASGVPAHMVMRPIAWVIVARGPGRGAAFALTQGVSQIGRGADQTVALDFGDMAISRQNHAAVRYDSATHRFQIGHGGKSNLVRLNGKPLLATETLADGDEIQIGETTLLLKVLCTA
ncbi:MAG: hypothetical protein B7Z31_10655, partial [Rhodobacterales bacterium 12-65-15]